MKVSTNASRSAGVNRVALIRDLVLEDVQRASAASRLLVMTPHSQLSSSLASSLFAIGEYLELGTLLFAFSVLYRTVGWT